VSDSASNIDMWYQTGRIHVQDLLGTFTFFGTWTWTQTLQCINATTLL